MLWVKLTPHCLLPHGYNCIIIGVVYHPPTSKDHLLNTLSRIECSIPNAGILLTGDFNRADISELTSQFHLTRMVKFPTRGERTLDLILSNLDRFYNNPEKFSPFGLSDHCTVALFPKLRVKENNSACKTIRIRKLKSISCMASLLEENELLSAAPFAVSHYPFQTF